MTDHKNAANETARFLKRTHGISGFAAHIPNSDGSPICKVTLNLSLWQIDECSLTPTLICNRCTTMQAKLARSSPIPRSHRSAVSLGIKSGGASRSWPFRPS
jgi:hypothetical protein